MTIRSIFHRRDKAGGERGQSAVEFVLMVPLLLLVMTGALSFGIALQKSLLLTNGVNVGGQLLAMSRGQTTDPCATAYTAINNASPGLSSGLSLSFVINGTTFSNTTTCTTADLEQGAAAQVTANYPCTLAIFEVPIHACSIQSQVTEYIQ